MLSRWLKLTLEMSGSDTTKFSAHSIRAASTSAALKRNVSIDSILKTEGWSKSTTFSQFYHKPVLEKSKGMSQSVLDSFVNKS